MLIVFLFILPPYLAQSLDLGHSLHGADVKSIM